MARSSRRIKEVIRQLVTIPIDKLDWDELTEWVFQDPTLQLEEVLHLVQIKKALGGDTKAYSLIMERVHGKVPTTNVAIGGNYKDFLESLAGEEPGAKKQLKDVSPAAEELMPKKLGERNNPNAIAQELLDMVEEEIVVDTNVEDLL